MPITNLDRLADQYFSKFMLSGLHADFDLLAASTYFTATATLAENKTTETANTKTTIVSSREFCLILLICSFACATESTIFSGPAYRPWSRDPMTTRDALHRLELHQLLLHRH